MRVPMRENASVTLNGSGAGTARVGPLSAREIWYPDSVSVSTNQTTIVSDAQCQIFVGDQAIQQNFRGSTFTGSSGDSETLTGTVKTGQYVWAVWTQGDAGALATVVVIGEKEV